MIQNIQKKKAVWKEALRGLLFLLGLFIEKQERRGLKRDRRETAVSNETEKNIGTDEKDICPEREKAGRK